MKVAREKGVEDSRQVVLRSGHVMGRMIEDGECHGSEM